MFWEDSCRVNTAWSVSVSGAKLVIVAILSSLGKLGWTPARLPRQWGINKLWPTDSDFCQNIITRPRIIFWILTLSLGYKLYLCLVVQVPPAIVRTALMHLEHSQSSVMALQENAGAGCTWMWITGVRLVMPAEIVMLPPKSNISTMQDSYLMIHLRNVNPEP